MTSFLLFAALLGPVGAFDGGSVDIIAKGTRSRTQAERLSPRPPARAAARARPRAGGVSVEEWLAVEVAIH